MVPGVPPEVVAGLVRVLASGAALGRGGRAGPGHVQVRRAPVPRRTASRPGSSRRPGRRPVSRVAARRPGPRRHRRPYTTIEPARPGRARRPGARRDRRAAGGPGAGVADRPPAAPDPPPGQRRWRTVTGESSRESSRESSQKRSTGWLARWPGTIGTIPPRSRARPL